MEFNFKNLDISKIVMISRILENVKDLIAYTRMNRDRKILHINELFDFIVELIKACVKERIDRINGRKSIDFPFGDYQSALVQLIELAENTLKRQQCRNQSLCKVIKTVLDDHEYIQIKETDKRILNYLVELIRTCDHEETIDCAWSALRSFPLSEDQSLQLIDLAGPSLIRVIERLTNKLQVLPHEWKEDKKWCHVFEILLLKNEFKHLCEFNQKFFVHLHGYYMKFFDHCNHMPTILSVVLLIEKLYATRAWTNDQINQLKDKLQLGHQYVGDAFITDFHSQFLFRKPLLSYFRKFGTPSALPDCKVDFERYQVDWCVNWFVDNMMGENEPLKMLPQVKLSPDRLEARNDRVEFVPVRSLFKVTHGVYFYEATILTDGKMWFGWNFFYSTFKCDQFSNGVCVAQHSILHNNKQLSIPNIQNICRPGDVIGCLIYCDQNRSVFYYNGQKILSLVSNNTNDSLQPDQSSTYCATACLSQHQQCHFNFGQSPFKFAPKDIAFRHFHEASGGDENRYRLTETDRVNISSRSMAYWFKHSPIGNQIYLYFRDGIQKEFDEIVKSVARDIRSNREIDWEMKNAPTMDQYNFSRFIQSTIEIMSKLVSDGKVDLAAQWIGCVMDKGIDQADKALLLQVLYPYLQLRINSSQNTTKHRYICIVFSYLIKYSQSFKIDLIEYIRKDTFTYLNRTLIETDDKWTHLFVLIALDNLKLNEEEIKMLKENVMSLEDWKNQPNIVMNRIAPIRNPLSYQLNLLIRHLLDSMNNASNLSQSNLAVLNVNERTEHLKLSHDLVSARSDWKWQSGRSVCYVNDRKYFYEAVLLTNGPMRIGWATKRTELVRIEVGQDAYSVGFDGYSRCVWHKKRKLNLETETPQWKVNDVVGCLFEVVKDKDTNKDVKKFSFYLNGRLVNFVTKRPTYSSQYPYHAAISLSAHQQVYLNFGQTKFKFPPFKDYLSLVHYSQISNPSMNFNNLTNAFINVMSNVAFNESISMSYQSSTPPPTIDNVLKKGLTFECITCPACHKEILLKRFLLDCCACLKLAMKTPTGNQLLTISSSKSNSDRLPLVPTSYHSEPGNISAESTTKCPICHKAITTKLLRFTCCDHLQFCFECARKLGDCLKCQQKPSTSKDCHVNKQQFECQFCVIRITTRPLQFFACDHGKLCHDCAKIIFDCPKCAK